MPVSNEFLFEQINGQECVVFITNGKNKVNVIVDKDIWLQYLQNFSWTAIKRGNRTDIITSINKQSSRLWRVIIEYKYDELDYFGATIDHINNNHLDNRLLNLRIYNTSILNTTNIASKYVDTDMQNIYEQFMPLPNGEKKINGYKVHFNISGKTYYKNFSIKEYGEDTLKKAREYRDTEAQKIREEELIALLKKCRDVEFERGLRDKLNADEREEIIFVLKKYGVNVPE